MSWSCFISAAVAGVAGVITGVAVCVFIAWWVFYRTGNHSTGE